MTQGNKNRLSYVFSEKSVRCRLSKWPDVQENDNHLRVPVSRKHEVTPDWQEGVSVPPQGPGGGSCLHEATQWQSCLQAAQWQRSQILSEYSKDVIATCSKISRDSTNTTTTTTAQWRIFYQVENIWHLFLLNMYCIILALVHACTHQILLNC